MLNKITSKTEILGKTIYKSESSDFREFFYLYSSGKMLNFKKLLSVFGGCFLKNEL